MPCGKAHGTFPAELQDFPIGEPFVANPSFFGTANSLGHEIDGILLDHVRIRRAVRDQTRGFGDRLDSPQPQAQSARQRILAPRDYVSIRSTH
jgi:hypothetical protein